MARNVAVLNLSRRRVRVGATSIKPAWDPATGAVGAAVTVDVSLGSVRKDLQAELKNLLLLPPTTADPVDLTAATGSASNTIADVGASFVQATLNNNFKSLAAKQNAVLAALRTAGILV